MMRTILTSLGCILIGPFTGYFVTYWLYSIGSHNDCMWRLAAFGLLLTVGAPLGSITFAVIGFWLGYRLDKKAKQQLAHQEESGSDSNKANLLNDGLADHHQSQRHI